MLEGLQVLSSIGALGLLIKIISSKFLSTEVEKALEMNYERIARTLVDYIIAIVIISITIVLLFITTMNKEDFFNSNIPEISSSKTKTDKNIKESKKENKKENKKESKKENSVTEIYILGTLYLIVLIYAIHEGRVIYKKLYKKNTYIWYTREGHKHKLYIEKRIEKDLILLKNAHNPNWHKTISLSTLENYAILTDSISDTNARRYKKTYEIIQIFVKSNWWVKVLIVLLLSIGFGPSIISTYGLFEAGAWKTALILSVFFLLILAYIIYQYKKGEKITNDHQS